jgi:hypothetical protein
MLVKKVKTSYDVTAMATDNTGGFVFIGDDDGGVAAFAVNLAASQVRKVTSVAIATHSITSVAWQVGWRTSATHAVSGHGGEDHADHVDYLVANAKNNAMYFLAFVHQRRTGQAVECGLHVLRTVAVPQHTAPLRSVFCTRGGGASLCVATGSEDGCVHIIRATAQRSDRLAVLAAAAVLGHAATSASSNASNAKTADSTNAGGSNHNTAHAEKLVVLNTAWDPTDTLLAAGTTRGAVVLWRRLLLDEVEVDFAQGDNNNRHGVVPGGASSAGSSCSQSDLGDCSSHSRASFSPCSSFDPYD